MDDDKKENFRMEIVKRVWFSQRFNKPCGHLPTINVLHMRSWSYEILVLASLCFQVDIVLVKPSFLLHISYTLETFHKSSVTVIFLEVADPFFAQIWSFMVFSREILIITLKLWSDRLHCFRIVLSYVHQYCYQIVFWLVQYYSR